jgi:hypothetical protein
MDDLDTPSRIAEMASRAQGFLQELTTKLKAGGVRIESTESFLLNSTAHPWNVPTSINGVPIDLSFGASVVTQPPRMKLSVRVNWGKPTYYLEVGQGQKAKFPIRRVMTRVLHELGRASRSIRVRESRLLKREQAELAFNQLASDLQITAPLSNPVVRLKNVRIKRIDQLPTRVALLLSVSHAEAIEILRYLGKS